MITHHRHKINTPCIRLKGDRIMAVKSVSIRIEEEMLKKLAYIADYEGRSVNSHILVLVRNAIKDFENENGSIDGDIRPDKNVKPSRR